MSLVLNSSTLGWLYPAHLITDSALTIRAFGPSIARALLERPFGRISPPSVPSGRLMWRGCYGSGSRSGCAAPMA